MGGLRSFAKAQGWKNSARFGTHSPRRGAARAILRVKGSFSKLLHSERWCASTFQFYLDLGCGEAQVVASVLIEVSENGD